MGDLKSRPIPPRKQEAPVVGQISKSVQPSKPAAPSAGGPVTRPSIGGSSFEEANLVHDRKRPRSVDRTLRVSGKEVNVTGFYEQFPSANGNNSGFTLQINQVGLVFCGWFSEVPSIVPNVSPIKTMKNLPPLTRIGFGVLEGIGPFQVFGDIRYLQFEWKRIKSKDGRNINDLDPSTDTVAPDDMGSGLLRLQPDVSQKINMRRSSSVISTILPRPTLPTVPDWIVTGINFSGRISDGFEELKLTKIRPRISFSLIQQQGELLRDALIATNVSILPESYIESLLRRVTRIFRFGLFGLEDDIPPATEANINSWIASTDEITKKVYRENALSLLSSFHTDVARLPYLFQREQIRDLFIQNAQFSKTRIKDKEMSYYKVYQSMLADELNQAPASETGLLKSIFDLGTFPSISKSRNIRYSIEFTPAVKTPNLIKGFGGPLSLVGGVYTVGLKRETVEFETDTDGRTKIDNITGNPVVKNILSAVDLSKGINLTDKHLAFTVAAGIDASADPVKVEIYSPIGDISYDDFRDATFNFVSASALPKVSIGSYAELKQVTTGFFCITLPRRMKLELWGSITETPGIELPTVDKGKKIVDTLSRQPESLSDAKKIGKLGKPYYDQLKKNGAQQGAEEWISDFKLNSWKINFSKIVSIGVGFGIISNSQELKSKIEKVTAPEVAPRLVEDSHGYGSRKIAKFFAQNDASLDTVLQAKEGFGLIEFIATRALIEKFLAENLYLLLKQEGELIIHGYASPEGPAGPQSPEVDDPFNVELSEARVDSVYRAIIDAMMIWENRWTQNVESEGYGEVPSRREKSKGGGGLIDPPSSLNINEFRAWCLKHRQEVEKWPEWRRVDVKLGGFASLRLYE